MSDVHAGDSFLRPAVLKYFEILCGQISDLTPLSIHNYGINSYLFDSNLNFEFSCFFRLGISTLTWW